MTPPIADPVAVQPPPAEDATRPESPVSSDAPDAPDSPSTSAVPAPIVPKRPLAPGAPVAPVATSAADSQSPATQVASQPSTDKSDKDDRITYLRLSSIKPNAYQPRQAIDEAGISRLADSIRIDGVMQPIIVREKSPGRYELIAGERRWRAVEMAGLDRVPAIVRDLTDQQAAQWALVENLQREDLNPIERAQAFQRLADQFKLSHDQIAKSIGIERSTVSNSLRLLNLCEQVQILLRQNILNAGQARAIASLVDDTQQLLLAKRAVRDAMSVRQVEAAVRKLIDDAPANPATASTTGDSAKSLSARQAHLADLADQISQQLGAKVAIKPARKKGAGSITIKFNGLEQFDQLLNRLGIDIQ